MSATRHCPNPARYGRPAPEDVRCPTPGCHRRRNRDPKRPGGLTRLCYECRADRAAGADTAGDATPQGACAEPEACGCGAGAKPFATRRGTAGIAVHDGRWLCFCVRREPGDLLMYVQNSRMKATCSNCGTRRPAPLTAPKGVVA